MNSLTRRLATVALGGALAVASLSGCGMFGTALDCGKLYSASNDVMTNINDPDGLKTAVEAFREAGKDINDSELKKAVNTFADEAEAAQKYSEDPMNAPAPDTAKMQDAVDVISKKCG